MMYYYSNDQTNIKLFFLRPSYIYPPNFRSVGPTISENIGGQTNTPPTQKLSITMYYTFRMYISYFTIDTEIESRQN